MKRLKQLLFLSSIIFLLSCSQKQYDDSSSINTIAQNYVRLGLFIGQYDPDFVDAYYGPDLLKPKNKPVDFPKDSVLKSITQMQNELEKISAEGDSDAARAKWMSGQLTSFTRRIKIYTGEFGTFDEESTDLFGTNAPFWPANA